MIKTAEISNQEIRRMQAGWQCRECYGVNIDRFESKYYGVSADRFECRECGCTWHRGS